MDGLYWETWFDTTNTTPDNIGYIFYENKVKNLIASIIIWFILFICKLMTEAHSLIAIYHSKIILFGNTSENRTAKNFDELRLSRKQTFSHIISTFEKLIPQFAQ